MSNTEISSDLVKKLAYQSGFDLVGIAKCTPLNIEIDRLKKWLDDDKHASMSWMSRNVDRRADPNLILPDCKSMIVVAVNYQRQSKSMDEIQSFSSKELHGKIASYAVNKDYHYAMKKQMKMLCREVNLAVNSETQLRWYVDTGPVMEKPWAQRAGLGFIGKNTCLINRQKGSWFFLGVILTDIELEANKPITQNWCGNCRACIDACPTDALDDIGTLDANKCISYLTIEHRDDVKAELKPKFEEWLFGCDICQEVCPYNIKFAKPSSTPIFEQIMPNSLNIDDILAIESEEEFRQIFKSKNPLRRAGLDGLQRTARILKEHYK